MPQDWLTLAKELYGPAQSEAVASAIRDLAAQFSDLSRPRPPRTGALPVDQRDAILITYGDQVQAPEGAPLRALGDFLRKYLKGTVRGVHLLPFYPSSSDDGFSVIDYLAVDPDLGDWIDVAKIADDFDLMFDAVFNHCSAKSAWFQKFLQDASPFRDYFVTVQGNPDLSQVVRPRALPLLTEFQTATGPRRVWTTFSADQVDLDVRNPEVLLELLRILLEYVRHGARFIRLDAIAYLWKEIGTRCIHLPQTHRIIQLMRSLLDEVAPDTILITETNVPHPDNVSYFGDGTNEAQMVYNFALPPLVLHSLASGDGWRLTEWARSLRAPSPQVTFFNFLASHDGIGVTPAHGILSPEEIQALVERAKAHGGFVSYKNNPDGSKSPYELNISYFDALSDPAAEESLDVAVRRFLVSQAIMLALPGVPGIYFHSLFGSRNDRAGAEESGIPRRINRQKLDQAALESELADVGSLRSRVFSGYQRLLQVRQSEAAFHPAGMQEVLSLHRRVFAVLRKAPAKSDVLLCLHNLAASPIDCDCGTAMAEHAAPWTDLISGSRVTPEGDSQTVHLGPYQVLWIRPA